MAENTKEEKTILGDSQDMIDTFQNQFDTVNKMFDEINSSKILVPIRKAQWANFLKSDYLQNIEGLINRGFFAVNKDKEAAKVLLENFHSLNLDRSKVEAVKKKSTLLRVSE